MDELLNITTWSVIEVQSHLAEKMSEFDLNTIIGGRFKLLQNYQESLMEHSEVVMDDLG